MNFAVFHGVKILLFWSFTKENSTLAVLLHQEIIETRERQIAVALKQLIQMVWL